jgi:hypothetical protein
VIDIAESMMMKPLVVSAKSAEQWIHIEETWLIFAWIMLV